MDGHSSSPVVSAYDRVGASRLLTGIAGDELLPPAGLAGVAALGDPIVLSYRSSVMERDADGHLTSSQLDYLTRFMAPCRPDQVTSATHRITWSDSSGTPNTSFFGPSGLGPVVPIVAREAVLRIWDHLAADPRDFAGSLDRLSDEERLVLASTTTDVEPLEIFRIGIESAARALVQHAFVADQVGGDDAATFARDLRDGGVFSLVGSRWYWELQASTLRRGAIPVTLVRTRSGRIGYSTGTLAVLDAMKEATVARAREVMLQATTGDGLSTAEAVALHHLDRDEISKQYALLPPGETTRCLALLSHPTDHGSRSMFPAAVSCFVETFCALLDLVGTEAEGGATDRPLSGPEERTFFIPDMNCQHCKMTITGVLESMGMEVEEIDLVTKRVVASFATVKEREQAFDAIRSGGYTIVPPDPG